MKAMIFAAGLGTRLKPLTDHIPKALVPVAGKPMLEHVILRLKKAGFNHLVINIHHFGDQILDFLAVNKNFDVRIDISDERDYLLDTGGAIKKAAEFLAGEEPFLIHNVDIVSNADLQELYNHHKQSGALATLLVNKRESSRVLLFDQKNHLCGWRNCETGEVKSLYPDFDPKRCNEYAFSGLHVLSPRVLECMSEWTGKFSVINFYLNVCTKANIQAYPSDDLCLIDIGKPESLEKAKELLKEKE